MKKISTRCNLIILTLTFGGVFEITLADNSKYIFICIIYIILILNYEMFIFNRFYQNISSTFRFG